MKFGINHRNTLTGAELAVRIFQIVSLLPPVYMMLASVYPYIFTYNNLFSVLFDLGTASLPRAETLALSLLYQKTASEIAVFYVILGTALIAGLAANMLLKGPERRARSSRTIWACAIAMDLLFRLMPLPFAPPAVYASVTGFALRLGCMVLILMDLRTDSVLQRRKQQANG